jgi:DNA-binding MarR family transcriptional regulator
MLRNMNYSIREASAPALSSADAAEVVVTVVPRVMRQIRAVARSAAIGLSVPQFRALRYVGRHPGDGLTPLADHLGVSLPAASALVGRLVAAGLVTRDVDPVERRRITIELTDRGRERVAASSAAVAAWWQERLSGLSPAGLEAIVQGFVLVEGVLGEAAEGADERLAGSGAARDIA